MGNVYVLNLIIGLILREYVLSVMLLDAIPALVIMSTIVVSVLIEEQF